MAIQHLGRQGSRRRGKDAITPIDVLVVGGGNAALCAALEARRSGGRVVIAERAPREWRGGNSKYTRNLRCVHGHDDVMADTYTEEEFLADLDHAIGPGTDLELTKTAIGQSAHAPRWMEQLGVRWQPAFRGTLQLSRTNRFFLGGGKALLNVYYNVAERLGVEVLYRAQVRELLFTGTRCRGARVNLEGNDVTLEARSVVVACGGFEANEEWLVDIWGEGARNFAVRGARQNDGAMLRHLLDLGADPCGEAKAMHAIAVDARLPRHEGGIVTRIDSIPFSIVVNTAARRFYDEGQDLWPKRYATWGSLIAEQPGQIVYSVFDAQVRHRFLPGVLPPIEADSVGQLAEKVRVPPQALEETIRSYNEAIVANGPYDHSRLDGQGTSGLEPPKSNWARPIATPPFCAYPLRPGVTFTYLGVRVNRRAQVLRRTGSPFQGLYAAGEIMAGNILQRGYVAGTGMTIGTVFGRIAGEEASRGLLH